MDPFPLKKNEHEQNCFAHVYGVLWIPSTDAGLRAPHLYWLTSACKVYAAPLSCRPSPKIHQSCWYVICNAMYILLIQINNMIVDLHACRVLHILCVYCKVSSTHGMSMLPRWLLTSMHSHSYENVCINKVSIHIIWKAPGAALGFNLLWTASLQGHRPSLNLICSQLLQCRYT